MECTVAVEVRLATEHADVGSLERTVSAALADVGARFWRELVARLEAGLPIPVACAACGGRCGGDRVVAQPRRGEEHDLGPEDLSFVAVWQRTRRSSRLRSSAGSSIRYGLRLDSYALPSARA